MLALTVAASQLIALIGNPLTTGGVRLKAAIEALPFERPKLAVTPVIDGNDFEGRLKRAIARSGKVIDANAVRRRSKDPIRGHRKAR